MVMTQIDDFESAKRAGELFGYPLMIKSKRLAYDGRGNAVAKCPEQLSSAVAGKSEFYFCSSKLRGKRKGSSLYQIKEKRKKNQLVSSSFLLSLILVFHLPQLLEGMTVVYMLKNGHLL